MKRKLQRVTSKIDVDAPYDKYWVGLACGCWVLYDATVDATVPNKAMCTGKCSDDSCDTDEERNR